MRVGSLLYFAPLGGEVGRLILFVKGDEIVDHMVNRIDNPGQPIPFLTIGNCI